MADVEGPVTYFVAGRAVSDERLPMQRAQTCCTHSRSHIYRKRLQNADHKVMTECVMAAYLSFCGGGRWTGCARQFVRPRTVQ